MKNWNECCICGNPLWNGHHIELSDKMKDKYFGNNPWPISDNENDRCCDECNHNVVVPERIRMIFKEN